MTKEAILKIPVVDLENYYCRNISGFTPSTVAKEFTIRYFVNVYVKHDAWNQDKGNKIITEIDICQSPELLNHG